MKNIIIAGPGRASKTTLARKINEELNYFVTSVDKLIATFQGAYPQLNIKLNWDRRKTTDNLAPFLELREYASQDAIPSNRSMTDHLVNYGFTIYDTSTEREQVFDKIVEDIRSKLV
jgi:hypothetical protein